MMPLLKLNSLLARFWLDDPKGTKGGSRWLTRGMFIRGITLHSDSVGLICVSDHVRMPNTVFFCVCSSKRD